MPAALASGLRALDMTLWGPTTRQVGFSFHEGGELEVKGNLEAPGPEGSRATPLGGMDHGAVMARVHVNNFMPVAHLC